ncbi:MAG TPA: ABC transporter permease [Pyrinomonadaceae bacterium]|nr:ABC transporter permease [Pyrinomonadaceae bacterium]
MESVFKDISYGLRSLLKHKTFTAISIVTLALGIGANAAIFTVVNAVVLRPLPYHDSQRLAMIWTTKDANQEQAFSFADYNDLKSQAKAFSAIGAASPLWNFILAGDGEPEPMQGLYVSANLFELLPVAPEKGRVFTADEDRAGGPPVVIISRALWERRFGADPNVIGKTMSVSGTTATIVGVMPAQFQFLDPAAELWAPLAQNQFAGSARQVRLLSVVGRLNDGVQVSEASAELTGIAQRLESAYPDTNSGVSLGVVPLHAQVTGKVRPALWLLFGAVGLVLLIACANIINLMLVRSAARRREIAVRTALGAGRMRLLRQLLTESITLSVLGGAAGILLGSWGVNALLALNPIPIPRYNKISVDLTVLAFTLLASVATGIVFGLAPAWQSLRVDLNSALKEGGRGAVAETGQRRLSSMLVIAEMAIAMVLLIGAGLLLRSFAHLLDVKPGFTTENLLTMQIGLPNAAYQQPEKRAAFMQQLETSLRGAPEVTSVGFVTRLPLMSTLNNVTTYLAIEGREVPPGDRPEIDFRRASTSYFQAMGIPLLSGRLVTEQDVTNNLHFVLINEAMAKRFWPSEDPVGKRISTALSSGQQTQWQTIVGVVGNVRHLGLDTEPRPEIYYHTNTQPPFGPVVVIRTTSDPKRLISIARAKVRELDRNVPISNVNTMEELVAQSVAQRRFGMFLLGIFALLALTLAAIGIYGVVSYSVTQRTQEIGVRMALGASTTDVLKMVLRKGMSLALIGVGVGLAGAFGLTRLMSRLLFEVTPTDVTTFTFVSVGLMVVALLACYLPARRAMKVDPLEALRYE